MNEWEEYGIKDGSNQKITKKLSPIFYSSSQIFENKA